MDISELKVHSLIKKPILTSKSYQGLANNKYVFSVHKHANKVTISLALKQMFNVVVEKVNIINQLGKKKVFRQTIGKRSDMKKAIVTLKQGHVIPEMKKD